MDIKEALAEIAKIPAHPEGSQIPCAAAFYYPKVFYLVSGSGWSGVGKSFEDAIANITPAISDL